MFSLGVVKNVASPVALPSQFLSCRVTALLIKYKYVNILPCG